MLSAPKWVGRLPSESAPASGVVEPQGTRKKTRTKTDPVVPGEASAEMIAAAAQALQRMSAERAFRYATTTYYEGPLND
jgi:hypothetical protein